MRNNSLREGRHPRATPLLAGGVAAKLVTKPHDYIRGSYANLRSFQPAIPKPNSPRIAAPGIGTAMNESL